MSVRVRVLDATVDVECDAELERRLAASWSRTLADGPPSEDDVALALHDAPEAAERAALGALTEDGIAASAGRLLMFHAAGVADGAGRVVALVGRSGSGKTTAAIRLSTQHFGYVTDETVAVDDDGAVLPFPRPLAIVDPASGRKSVRSPDELGLRELEGPAALARLLLLDRQDASGAEPHFDEIDLLSGISELIPQMSALPSLDRPLQRLADLVDRCGGVHRFSFSGIGDAEARAIQDFLDVDLQAKDRWSPLERPADDDISRNLGLRDTRIRRGGVLDGIRVDDEALLMVGATPIRLSGLGLTIWEAAAGAPTFDELVDRVVAEHGPHPDAESLVREAVDSMVEANVLGFGAPVTVSQFLASMVPQLPAASDDACCGGA